MSNSVVVTAIPLISFIAATIAVRQADQCIDIEVRTQNCSRPQAESFTITTTDGNNASFVCYKKRLSSARPIFIVRKPNGLYYDKDEIRDNRSDAIIETDLNPTQEGLCTQVEDCRDGNYDLFQYHYIRLTLLSVNKSLDRSLISCGYITTVTLSNGIDVDKSVFLNDPFLLVVETQEPHPSVEPPDPGAQNDTNNCRDSTTKESEIGTESTTLEGPGTDSYKSRFIAVLCVLIVGSIIAAIIIILLTCCALKKNNKVVQGKSLVKEKSIDSSKDSGRPSTQASSDVQS